MERTAAGPQSDSRKESKRNIWTSLLDSVASSTGRTFPTKTLLVLGGGVKNMQQFERDLRKACLTGKPSSKTSVSTIPSACDIVTGYSYIDLKDREEDETMARINLYMVPENKAATIKLLKLYLDSIELKDVILCILLDWKRPWSWLREMRSWIRQWKGLIKARTTAEPSALADVDSFSTSWRTYLRKYKEKSKDADSTIAKLDTTVVIPLSEGQFSDSLGVSLLCVAQNADYINELDRQYGFKEEQFDFIQQVLRTIILRHGGSLIYTTPTLALVNYLPLDLLVRQHLSSIYDEVQGKSEPKEPSILNRSAVYVPAGWDTWGKIRVLREGFDTDGIAAGWEVDLEETLDPESEDAEVGAVDVYEEVIQEPKKLRRNPVQRDVEVIAMSPMEFLRELEQQQWEVGKNAEEGESPDSKRGRNFSSDASNVPSHSMDMEEIDAKLKSMRLKNVRQTGQASSPRTTTTTSSKTTTNKDEYVQAFFQNLLTRSTSDRSEVPKSE